MDSQPALERCPFCGGEAAIESAFYDCYRIWIQCKQCQAQTFDCDDAEAAAALWNRRVPATQPPQAMPYSRRNGETDRKKRTTDG